jgi:hypothetical protein
MFKMFYVPAVSDLRFRPKNLSKVIPLFISIINSTNSRVCTVHSFAFLTLCYVKLPEYSTFIRIIIEDAPEENTIIEHLQ